MQAFMWSIFQKSCFGFGRNSIRKIAFKVKLDAVAATFHLPAIKGI